MLDPGRAAAVHRIAGRVGRNLTGVLAGSVRILGTLVCGREMTLFGGGRASLPHAFDRK